MNVLRGESPAIGCGATDTWRQTLEHVVDIETGARGFVATGQEHLLDPFNTNSQGSLNTIVI